MGILNIIVGAPGSGKSTFIKNHLAPHRAWVSRDTVRFEMVDMDEPYFSKEKEVFQEFVERINTGLEKGYEIFADATHLNKASRAKLMNAINFANVIECNVIWIKTPLEVCLQRNEERAGTRSYVPESAIHQMYNNFQKPTLEEGFDNIYIVEDTKPIQIVHRDTHYTR